MGAFRLTADSAGRQLVTLDFDALRRAASVGGLSGGMELLRLRSAELAAADGQLYSSHKADDSVPQHTGHTVDSLIRGGSGAPSPWEDAVQMQRLIQAAQAPLALQPLSLQPLSLQPLTLQPSGTLQLQTAASSSADCAATPGDDASLSWGHSCSFGSSLLTASGSVLTASGSFLNTSGSFLNPSGSPSVGFPQASSESTAVPECTTDASLAPEVLGAVAAAWPGSSALTRLKRRAALALAAAREGPEGPHSLLASALGDVLHKYEPDAVSELRHPVTKTLRVKQLLHEGGGEGEAAALGQAQQAHAAGGAAAAMQHGGEAPHGYLRVIKGRFDIVVVLDMAALMQAHGYGGTGAGPGATPPPPPADGSDPHGPAAPLLPKHAGSNDSGGPGVGQAQLAAAAAAGPVTLHAAAGAAQEVAAVDPAAAAPSSSAASAASGSSPTAASASAAPDAAGSGAEGIADLALRAFPGSSPAAQLRRSIAEHLGGVPRRALQWAYLASFVAGADAELAMSPSSCGWPKLRSFVLHPDSREVFTDAPLPGVPAGSVSLDLAALRRAATAGLAAAVAACWPGFAPLERIRRAAAFTLAFAARGPAGPYTMLGSALGTAIRKRDKEAFDSLAGMGKLSDLLDDTDPPPGASPQGAAPAEPAGGAGPSADAPGGAGGPAAADPGAGAAAGSTAGQEPPATAAAAAWEGTGLVRAGSGAGHATTGSGGYIVSFKKDQDGYMRLHLEALLRDWPKDEGGGTASSLRGSPDADAGAASSPDPGAYPTDPAFATDPAAPGRTLAPATSSQGVQYTLATGGGSATPTASTFPVGEFGAAGMDGGGGGSGGGSGGGAAPPLEQELLRRFPSPPGGATGTEQATIAAAKRCIARLLAWAPPPNQLTFAKLGAQVPKLLGGARIGRNLRLVCLEEPDVFAVQSQSPTVHVVRLVCPRLLQLAQEQGERRSFPAQQQQHAQQAMMLPAAQAEQAGQVLHVALPQQQQQPGLPLQLHGAAQIAQHQLQNQYPPQQQQQLYLPTPTHPLQQAPQHVAHLQQALQQHLQQQQHLMLQQGQQQSVQVLGRTPMEPVGQVAAAAGAASAAWVPSSWVVQQPPHHLAPQQHHPQALQPQHQNLQQHHQMGIQQLRHPLNSPQQQQQLGGGSGAARSVRLYDDLLRMQQGPPLSASAGAGPDGLYGRQFRPPLDAAAVAGPWHSGAAAAAAAQASRSRGGSGGGAGLQQQQHRLPDFAAVALLAEQALQPQSGASSAALLPPTTVHLLADPHSPAFFSVLQHCYSCSQLGLAVQSAGGRVALVALYAPAAEADGGGAEGGGEGTAWPAALYMLECTANAAGGRSEAVASTLLASLRGLLEEPAVAKVVHGCEQVRPLEAAAGAVTAPLLDTRVLLDCLATMLPPLPPAPIAASLAAAAAAGPLPPTAYGPAEAAAMAQLASHVRGLRGALQSVELWAERPEMLEVLAGQHFAALRAELWAAAGRDSTWLVRPLTESQAALATQGVRHLPELWAALCEAVPWLAAHAALRLMQHLRS